MTIIYTVALPMKTNHTPVSHGPLYFVAPEEISHKPPGLVQQIEERG